MASNGLCDGVHGATDIGERPRRYTRQEALTSKKTVAELEAQRLASLRYYYRHRQEILERRRRKREEDPEGYRRSWREWMKKYPNARQHYKETNPKYSHYKLLKHLDEVERRGGKCQSCGFSNPLALAIHHAENGQLMVLCFNCHQILHVKKSLQKTNTSHPRIRKLLEEEPWPQHQGVKEICGSTDP